MKKFLLTTVLFTSVCFADEPLTKTALAQNTDQCREWAVMDGIEQEMLDDYMTQCLMDMSNQEPDVESYDYVELSSDDEQNMQYPE